MERKFARELTQNEIRKKLGLKGDRDPALSVGLIANMHALIRDHGQSHVAVGRSIGLNEKESNKYLSYPHLKTFSKDKFGKVRMFFARTDEALALVRRLSEKHNGDAGAVGFEIGLDMRTVKDLVNEKRFKSALQEGRGMHVVNNGETTPFMKWVKKLGSNQNIVPSRFGPNSIRPRKLKK